MTQIPSYIKEIKPYSFYQSDIKKITFENNSKLIKIGKEAFNKCKLNSIEIPSSVKLLDDGFLGQRWTETKVTISNENKCYKLIDDNLIIGKSDENKDEYDVVVLALLDIKEVIIPSSIKYINSFSFCNCQFLSKVEFQSNSNLISIGEFAFGFSIIEDISIPKSCKIIKKHAFGDCKYLKSINFDDESELISIPTMLFSESLIEKFTITKNIQKIEQGCFDSADCLNQVIISPGNKYFEYLDDQHKIIVRKSNQNNSVFDVLVFACRDIKKVFIPSTIKYIDSYCFCGCKKLKKIEFAENSQLISIGKKSFSEISIKSIELPSSLTNISPYAFSFCKKLDEITIPADSKLESIHEYTFFYTPIKKIFIPPNLAEFGFIECKNLTDVEISPENKNFKYLNFNDKKIVVGKSNPKNIEFDTIIFACIDIQKVFIPSSIKHINYNAFSNCNQLQEITFDENSKLLSIDKQAFASTDIRQIKIPSHVKFIGESCFSSCMHLKKIDFENNSELKVFNNYLFDSSNIESISFPSSLRELKVEWCSCAANLNHIYLPPENKNFSYLDKNQKIICGKTNENLDIYDSIVFVARDTKKVLIPSTITQINAYAFSESGICNIFIPKSVTKIGEFAFYNCRNLMRVEFENESKVASIGYNCFGYCLIENIIIPNQVKFCDLNALVSSYHLKTIEFLSDEIVFDGFLCINCPFLISFPNAHRICIDQDSFLIYSDFFSLFTCANVKLEY